MMSILKKKNIAILAENGFEEIELVLPKKTLEKNGAEVSVVSPREDKIRKPGLGLSCDFNV